MASKKGNRPPNRNPAANQYLPSDQENRALREGGDPTVWWIASKKLGSLRVSSQRPSVVKISSG